MPTKDFDLVEYKPFKAGFPDFKKYLKETWMRRDFLFELSRTERDAENLNTIFGRLWGLVNPLLSAIIYFLFIFIVQGGNQGSTRFLHLVAGIFVFEFITRSATRGANSIVAASSLINNTKFPRIIIPMSNVLTSWQIFLPTIPIYLTFHFILKQPLFFNALQALAGLLLIALFASGLAMFAATAQIYLRDTAAIIPFLLRLMMFASPILYFPEQAKLSLGSNLISVINPLFSLIEIFSGSLVRGDSFNFGTWLTASCWSVSMFLVGFLFLTRREGEFAARI